MTHVRGRGDYMDNSILNSVKRSCGGISADDTHFDEELIMHTNAVFATLNQMGVGPKEGFMIEDASKEWSDFISNDASLLYFVKTYVGLKVRQIFDPPSSSALAEALKQSITELEWRISVAHSFKNQNG